MWLAMFLLLPAWAQAAPPDLTATGVIAALKADDLLVTPLYSPRYSQTYNLGATGLRGWIYISSGNMGPDDIITGESRQILVTVASTPGSAVLAVDDVILGVMAGSSGTVPLFTSDSRKAFGAAIGDAESIGAGTLRVKRWRGGIITDVNISMTIMGNYTDTAPYSCPKSAQILANARTSLVSQLIADPNFLTNDYAGSIKGLALLAGVTSADANYSTVQTRLQTFARALAATTPVPSGLYVWDWGYISVFLGEYYLRTVADGAPDANVLTGINNYTVALAKVQSRYGTYGHGGSLLKTDGSLHGTIGPYGPVNQAGLPANIGIVMGKQALVAAGQSIDPEIDPAILRGGNFFAWYVNKGPIPYGEHEPFMSGHSPNGKDALCAVLFGLQPTRTVETEYFTRMTTAGFNGREYGHTGQGFSYLWGAMGANMGGALAVAQYLKPVRWHLDLERRTDGSFVYDGQEQFGAGSTADGTYLGKSGYYDINPTASYILTYSLPLQRINITGKNAIPANTLDATKVANAIAAATFDLDCHALNTTQLIAALSEFDPVVRNYAAVELATRTLLPAELTTLRTMVSDTTNANGRQGACQTLGLLKDATAMPLITQRLDKTVEPDSWVRAKAASALRSYTAATASTQRDPMLTAFTANATDPDVIVWDDPIQISNGYLGFALFGDAVYGGTNIATYTINGSKSLLYPAVQAGLKQPDSKSRFGVANFCYNYLTLADVQALIPDLFEVVDTESQADTMWSMNPRGSGIATLAKYKITEGIPEALAMLVVPTGFGWGSDGFQVPGLNALAAYGDAARWTLPTLRSYLGTWDPTSTQYATLVKTIASIEAAITAATQAPGLAVANSQVMATTTAKAITLTGSSPRTSVTFANVTAPAHGTLTGTAPNLTYTPAGGYTGPDCFTFQVTDVLTTSAPATVSIIVGTAGTGLKGEYYDNMDFTNLKVTRTDAQVNFDWGTGSPDPSVGADTFSVRWSGLLLVPETGTYKFSTLNSDGARLYINGALVIDDFVDQTTNWIDGASLNLMAGQMVDLQMEYYENTGSAVAKLKWTGPSFAGANGAIIATQWLYDGTGVTNRTPYAHAQSLTLVQNTAQAITLTGSGGTLSYAVVNQPAHGTLTGTAPYLTYTPATNYSGSDSFTFLVNNGTSNSSPATVSISIWAGQPVSYTWNGATTGNWSLAGNWTSGAPAATGMAYGSLNFATAGTYTVTQDMNNGFLLNQLNVAGAVTFAGTNSLAFTANGTLLPQFNQNSSSLVTFNTPLSLTAMTSFGGSGGGEVDLANSVSGTGGINKVNAGMLKLYGLTATPNTYSGGTIVSSGTLHLGTIVSGISPLCTNPAGTGAVTLNSGTIEFDRTTSSNALTINGGTLYSNNGWGSTWSGPITLNAIGTVNAAYNLTLSGNISGSGGLIKTGGSTLFLSGTNSFTGANRITAGTLSCSNSAALGTGSLDISNGAMVALNYTGTRMIAALTFNAGAPLVPGTYGSTASSATNKTNTYFSGTGMVTVLPATTTALSLTSGSTPSNSGSSLTFSATVTGTSPTGNVMFYDGTTLLGTSALNASFQATLTTSSLAIGIHSITAQYAGNSGNATSTSAALAIEITSMLPPAPTNLFAAPGSNHVGLTWSISAAATSYYVKRSLTNGGTYTVIGNPSSASYDDLTASNGTTYYYVVSAINSTGESTNSNQVSGIPAVQPSTTTLVSSPVATGSYGTAVTFTATVTVSSGTATGTVTFKDGSTVLGTGTLSAGTATFATSALAVANHSVTANYGGDGTFTTSVSAPCAYLVTAKSMTLTGVTAANKVYDGNATATLTGGTVSGGLVGSETLTVVLGNGTFSSANAGTWAVTATGYSLGGPYAGNYVLAAQPTVSNATISPRPLQLTGSGTRAYDATAVVTAASLTISNKVSGDDITLAGSATLAAKDVGSQGVLSGILTPARVGNAATGNTGLNAVASFTVTMSAAPTSGNTLVAVITTRGYSTNRVSSISQTGVTWSKAPGAEGVNTNSSSGSTTEIWVGSSITLTAGTVATISFPTGTTLRAAAVIAEYSGLAPVNPLDKTASSNGNSTIASTGTTSTTTQAFELWIGGIGLRDSTYTLVNPANAFTSVVSSNSTNTTTSTNAKAFFLENIVSSTGTANTSGTITSSRWSGAIATFKAASLLNLTLSGTSAANYTLTGITGSVTISPKTLTLTATPAVTPKSYDGLIAASLTGATLRSPEAAGTGTTTDGTPYTGDALNLILSGSFDTKDTATGKAVTSTSTLTGANAGNYSLTQPSGLTGNITPKALTLTSTPVVTAKPYDGLIIASLSGATLRSAEAAGTGTTVDGTPYTGDTVNLILSGSFDTKNAASGKAVTSTSSLSGANAGNYALTQPTGLTGTITPASLTVTANNQSKTYGQTLAFGSGAMLFTNTALQNDEMIGSVTLTCAGGDPAAAVASYPITPGAATGGTFSSGNYTISYVPGTLSVNPAGQTITFGTLADRTYGDAPYSLTATTDSGLTVSYASSDPAVASVSGNTVTLLKAGSTTITASQLGDGNHNAATPVAQTLTVNKAAQTITFGTLADRTYGDAPFDLTATADSGLTVSYASSDPAVASASGNTVTLLKAGSTTITASQLGDGNHNAASPVAQTLTVKPMTMTAYEAWAGGAAFDGDANDDGVPDGLAWLLGATSPSVNASELLPKPTNETDKLVLTFRCLKTANRGAVLLKVQYSNDIGQPSQWANHEAVLPDADGTVGGVVFAITPDADSSFINVRAEIPAIAASPVGKLFARLYASGN